MKLQTELLFNFRNAQGELKVVYSPFSTKLYQDGREVKRKGAFSFKYEILTLNGGTDVLTLSRGIDFAYSATFQGETIQLEEKLSVTECIIGFLPLVLIFLGGLIGAFFGIIGATVNFNFMRVEKSLPKQIIISVIVSIIAWACYFFFAILFNMALGRV